MKHTSIIFLIGTVAFLHGKTSCTRCNLGHAKINNIIVSGNNKAVKKFMIVV